MKTREETGASRLGHLPASPAHRPRGKREPWALLDPGADSGRQSHATRPPPAESCRNGSEALTSVERNWGEVQMETGAFCVILNFPEPRRRSPWLCMNFSDLTGWPEGQGGRGGGPHALRPLPTEARPLAPASRLAQVTDSSPGALAGRASAPTWPRQDVVLGRTAASRVPAAPEAR